MKLSDISGGGRDSASSGDGSNQSSRSRATEDLMSTTTMHTNTSPDESIEMGSKSGPFHDAGGSVSVPMSSSTTAPLLPRKESMIMDMTNMPFPQPPQQQHANNSQSFYHQLMATAAQQQFPANGAPGDSTPRHFDPVSSIGLRQQQLSRAKLKATSRTSALLAGFAMVALVELDYNQGGHNVDKGVLIAFAIITTLLVSVHLLALMMSTCILPHLETSTSDLLDSPQVRLKWYIELSWFFSTCLGLLLFLLEIGVVFWIKFAGIEYQQAAYVTTGILVPIFAIFLIFTYNFYKKLMRHRVNELGDRLQDMDDYYKKMGLVDPGMQPSTPFPLHNPRGANII